MLLECPAGSPGPVIESQMMSPPSGRGRNRSWQPVFPAHLANLAASSECIFLLVLLLECPAGADFLKEFSPLVTDCSVIMARLAKALAVISADTGPFCFVLRLRCRLWPKFHPSWLLCRVT